MSSIVIESQRSAVSDQRFSVLGMSSIAIESQRSAIRDQRFSVFCSQSAIPQSPLPHSAIINHQSSIINHQFPTPHSPLPTQYTPTVVCPAILLNGRTPLTPSHGYLSQGFSRSPSSRSRKPGMNVSRVNVVSRTRPVSRRFRSP